MMKDPARLAWTVLLIALVMFCTLTTSTFLVVRWFLFDSTTPMTTMLSVARSTVGVRANLLDAAEEVERSSRYLQENVRLTTDGTSQGVISFTDLYTHETIATVVLHRDSALTLSRAAQPRFNFSSGWYTLSIRDLTGSVDVDIVPGLPRGIILAVESPLGQVSMTASGRYRITSQESELSLLNRNGEAFIVDATNPGRVIPEGMEGRIAGEDGSITVTRTVIDILEDISFDTFNPANPELSSAWRCYTLSDDPEAAVGTYRREELAEGRSAMHITRIESAGEPANNHAETGCRQYLNTINTPLSVEGISYLELRATMQINEPPQTLSTCGVAGSECPVMLEINYIDQYGEERHWIQGFYARYDPATGYPLRCDTCTLNHERINKDTWYTYSSGNLLQLIPEAQRPVAIRDIHFYSSGHEYEMLLSEVALLADTVPVPPATQPTPTPEVPDLPGEILTQEAFPSLTPA
ncbi:MAG: hypothetical protein JW910_15680, partial [Anaerolineae bacterium]|nr:hypothetical protein [Anaerolineae bacterium]